MTIPPKQAVVLIHGIGEQVPMDTLRGFVRAVWTTDESVRNPYVPDRVWSKPDTVSQNYELRRLTTAEGKNGRRTDFFELYWADLMEGTQVSHLIAWLRVLLFRSPRSVPRQLVGLWGTIAVLTAAIPLALVLWKLGIIPLSAEKIATLTAVATAVWLAASGIFLNIAGDAARYLHVAPPNIARRRVIRDAGIQLLTRLHSSADYDRIIVVGHSLGSVVGYDVLTHLWPRHNTSHASNAGKDKTPAALETLAAKPDLNAAEYQAAQPAYAADIRSKGNSWLVTDFVTLGSPLAHAPFLLARKSSEFQTKKTERELPTCPPELEQVKGEPRFSYPLDKAWVPHHAAVFGPTRWTNLYFPCTWTFKGDVIGGPMQPVFGPGIVDIPVETSIRGGLLTHTCYWSMPAETTAEPPGHIAALRQALRLS